MGKKQYKSIGLLRVRLWEELNKYTEEGKYKSDNTPVKGYDLGKKDFAKELWKLINN